MIGAKKPKLGTRRCFQRTGGQGMWLIDGLQLFLLIMCVVILEFWVRSNLIWLNCKMLLWVPSELEEVVGILYDYWYCLYFVFTFVTVLICQSGAKNTWLISIVLLQLSVCSAEYSVRSSCLGLTSIHLSLSPYKKRVSLLLV